MKIFVSYKDEKDETISGFFEVIDENRNGFIVFKTSDNETSIPLSRVLKLKKKLLEVD